MNRAEQLADTIPPPPPTMPAPPAIKTCACGRSFDHLEWNALPLVGFQSDFEGGEYELRDCACSSTLAMLIPGRQDGEEAMSVPESTASSAVRVRPAGSP